MYFIDSSALVAMLAPEDDGETYAQRLDSSHGNAASAIVVYETVLALARLRRISVAEALMIVLEHLQRAGVELMSIGADAHVAALSAHERYGKGTGHPAQINLGDCFSYAMAKAHNLKILYKGNDFAQTDMA
jgi:ribonuclease VapC